MAAATITLDLTDRLVIPGMALVHLTTTGTSSTYVCPYFSEIVTAVATNASDKDGVGVAVSGTTVTVQVITEGDVVYLWVCGRP